MATLTYHMRPPLPMSQYNLGLWKNPHEILKEETDWLPNPRGVTLPQQELPPLLIRDQSRSCSDPKVSPFLIHGSHEAMETLSAQQAGQGDAGGKGARAL